MTVRSLPVTGDYWLLVDQRNRKQLPYKIHTILSDNGVLFTNRKQDTSAFEHIFDFVLVKKNLRAMDHVARNSRSVIDAKRHDDWAMI